MCVKAQFQYHRLIENGGDRGCVGNRRRAFGTYALDAKWGRNMNDLSRLDGSNRPPQFREERPIERDLVSLRMKNHKFQMTVTLDCAGAQIHDRP